MKETTVKQALDGAVEKFDSAGLETPRLDAEVLLSHCLDIPRYRLHTDARETVSLEKASRFASLIARRLQGESVAYIVGSKEFWSLKFDVDESVLVPRPDTEPLLEEALRLIADKKSPRILDIGTGSGIIGIVLARERKDSRVFAGDISEKALRIARRNALHLGVGHRISYFCGDLLRPLSGFFDIVVSNPPYVEEREYSSLSKEVQREPKAALVAGPLGTEFHRELIEDSRSIIRPGGWLVMEMGSKQKDAVERVVKEVGGYDVLRFRKDYGGNFRVVSLKRGTE